MSEAPQLPTRVSPIRAKAFGTRRGQRRPPQEPVDGATWREAVAALAARSARPETVAAGAASSALFDAWLRGEWMLVDRFDCGNLRVYLAGAARPGFAARLTALQRRVAEGIGRGQLLKQIADELTVSIAAVCNTALRVEHALGLENRVELAAFFAPGGLSTQLAVHAVAGVRVLVGATRVRRPELWALLSFAEREIADLIVRGAHVDQIAVLRGTSTFTVDTQIASIYEKLGIGSRNELAIRVAGLAFAREEARSRR